MAEAIPQRELLRRFEEELAGVDADARRLVDGLSEAQLAWSPPDGGWSISQVYEHLATSNRSYLGPMRDAIERAEVSGRGNVERAWTPSFFGGILARSLQPSARRGLPTPKIWKPSADAPRGSLEAFLATQRTIAELLGKAHGIDLVGTRVSSPVSRFIRMNLGDAFQVLLIHDRRHLGQIERILGRETFPRA